MLRSFRRLVARFSELRDPEAVIIWNPLMDVLSDYVRLCSLRLLHKELGHSLARRATVSPKSRAPRPLKFEASFHACLPHNCAASISPAGVLRVLRINHRAILRPWTWLNHQTVAFATILGVCPKIFSTASSVATTKFSYLDEGGSLSIRERRDFSSYDYALILL